MADRSVTVTANEFAGAGAQEGVKAAIVAAMIRLHAQAVTLAPVDTGQLRSSIMWRKGWAVDAFGFPAEGGFNEAAGAVRADRKIEEPRGIEGVVGTAVLHGTYQEFGTRYMPAQPFMRPAVDAVRGASAAEIARRYGREAMEREFARRKVVKK